MLKKQNKTEEHQVSWETEIEPGKDRRTGCELRDMRVSRSFRSLVEDGRGAGASPGLNLP